MTSTNITDEERKLYDTVMSKFDAFFKVRRNVIYERARFNRRNQREGETAEQYIMELYALAEYCEYGDLKDEMIRDRLVVGIRDAALSQQLQLDAELTLEKAKLKVRQREAVGEQQRELKGTERAVTSLGEVRPRKSFTRKTTRSYANSKSKSNDPSTTKLCSRCGKESHPRDKCPAKDAICHTCKKKGHFSSQCFTKMVKEITIENPLDTAFLGTLEAEKTATWSTTVKLSSHSLNFKLDTGAEVTAISEKAHETIGKPQLSTPKKVLCGPSQQPLKTLGQFVGTLSHRRKTTEQNVFVVSGLKSRIAWYHSS